MIPKNLIFALLAVSFCFSKCTNIGQSWVIFCFISIILLLVLIALEALAVTETGATDSSLSCYVCNDCPQPFNPNATGVTNKSGCTTCQKTCYNKTVDRSCATSTSGCYNGLYFGCKVCESDTSGTYDITICCNDRNLCNSAWLTSKINYPLGSFLYAVIVACLIVSSQLT